MRLLFGSRREQVVYTVDSWEKEWCEMSLMMVLGDFLTVYSGPEAGQGDPTEFKKTAQIIIVVY